MSQKIGVLGSGLVGEVLADGFLRHGYPVMRGSRTPEKLAAWSEQAGPRAETGTFEATAAFGEILVLAVKGTAAESVVRGIGAGALAGKIVIDAANPIADEPPQDGVIRYTTGPNESLMERLQQAAPEAHFVKAFSCVGNPNFVNPDFGASRPTMFICGNDDDAKRRVASILDQFGWDSADMGSVVAARAIEPLAILWCIPGFRSNEWTHAFKMLRR